MDNKFLIGKLNILNGKLPEIVKQVHSANYEEAGRLLGKALAEIQYWGTRDRYNGLHSGPTLVGTINLLVKDIERKSEHDVCIGIRNLRMCLAQATLPDGSDKGSLTALSD